MHKPLSFLLSCAALAAVFLAPVAATAQQDTYGLALHGAPKYPADFTHFDYANPDAPKGGTLHLGSIGTYNSLNPYILTAVTDDGAGLQFETLMAGSADEPFSQYGWVAQSMTVAPDHSWVSYKLHPEARFHDGSPITPEDVIFSFEILKTKGHPYFRSYYKNVVKAEKTGPHEVKFTFNDTTNTELPMIMGQLPVLSKKWWKGKDFAAVKPEAIMGSGPYEAVEIDPGRSTTYKRVANWWAKDLPVNRGRYNFDAIHYDYYRDTTVALEAFLAGRYDVQMENAAKHWALDYNTPAVQQGLIQKALIKNEVPTGMQAFIMNTRRPIFQDRRVREALNYAFDFEWANKNVAYGAYTRTESYFENSDLAAKGTPSPDELKLLEPYRNQLPPELFAQAFEEPKTDGSGNDRENLHKAADLLREAGWTLKDGQLVNAQGQPFTFEIIEVDPMIERWTQPFMRNLERLGIKATFRIIDTAQFQHRMENFDYDMTVHVFSQSLSPGNEQFDYWGSRNADVIGSRNVIGVRDPVVDALLEKLVHAQSREDLVTVTHALDRVLLWQYYGIPNWYIGSWRVAYWNMFGRPDVTAKYALGVEDSWWLDKDKAPKILDAQNRH